MTHGYQNPPRKPLTITGRAPAAERGAELYETPLAAVTALCRADPWLQAFKRTLWDPACGPGAIVEALAAEGHVPLASDLMNYETRWRGPDLVAREWRRDFRRIWPGGQVDGVRISVAEAIVMNPPYSMAEVFLVQAMRLVPRVYCLLELGWMQGESRVRDQLLDGGHWAALYPFRERLDMDRDGWDGPDARSTRKHGWFVFTRAEQAGSAPSAHEPGSRLPAGPFVRRLSIKEDLDD